MIGGLEPYEATRKLSLPWLDELPRHWSVRRLRTLARRPIRNGVGESAQGFRADWPRYVRITDIAGPRTLRETNRASLPSDIAGETLEPGDLLIAAVGATYGKSYLHADLGAPACYAGYLVRVAPTHRVLPEFLSYWTESSYYWNQVNSEVIQATIQNFSAARVKALRVPLPPVAEQQAIVRFLDYADLRIRRYIGAKQKLIKLLEEQKQAIIHRAVTRGLDANVSLKASGVEWLGDIPEHWEVQRCRYLFREVDNRSLDGSEEHLSMSQRLGLVPSHQVDNRTLIADSYAGGKLCNVGDLVLNRLKAHLGVFSLAKHHGVVSPDYTVLRPIHPDSGNYFAQVLKSPACRGELRTRAKGIVEGFWRLYTNDFFEIRLPVPPDGERREISAATQVITDQVERTIQTARKEISLLSEYRARLTADLVTGKLDVRLAAARLSDEADEADPPDETEGLTDDENDVADGVAAVLEEIEL